jgi:thiosulfate/3-mercaptopyruvate sulfurtransferase
MAVPPDPTSDLQDYAHPERLVTTAWLVDQIAAGRTAPGGGLVVVESDEDVLLYETGHIPGAIKVDWHTELNDQVTRDYLDGAGFAELCAVKGISREDTVVFYGDNFNWWAAYALWVFSLFGHPDVRLVDGGRQKWVAEGRELTREVPTRPRADYPVVERDDAPIRAYRDQVMTHVSTGRPLVDVRSPGEYTGELLSMPDYPQEGALRGGHIPGAVNKPWKQAARDDGGFKGPAELAAIYRVELGLNESDDIVAYCRIGERSSHTWFVLTHLLGYPRVRNYDGSWTEWGNLVRAPVAKGSDPGGLTV